MTRPAEWILLFLALSTLPDVSCKSQSTGSAPRREKSPEGVQKTVFGKTPAGEEVHSFLLWTRGGIRVKLIDYGARIVSLEAPDKRGVLSDIVLGHDDLEGYRRSSAYFGCTTGRVANRIARGRFSLDGKEFKLAINNGPNHLHGGLEGLDRKVWKGEFQVASPSPSVRFTYLSPHGDEGYPGNLSIQVVYSLIGKDQLKIDYTAETDQPTPVNLTNHSYFNLSGQGNGTILDHQLQLESALYTPVDATGIPTGDLKSVKGTVMDFSQPMAIGARIAELGKEPGGYDHNYVLKRQDSSLSFAARVYDPKSGRVMEVSTTEPGVQLYTGNYLDGSIRGKGGKPYRKHAGLCLETQHYPDSVNRLNFPSIIVRPGEVYHQTTVFRFYTR